MPRLAIIGGGPKGAAVAAKAWALANTARYRPPDVVIYERQGIGAAWSGQSGYTDGLQPLCTPAERDLGYPYDRASFGRDVASAMSARFSWHAFCVAEGMGATEYDQWVLYDRSPPVHRDFARYLQSVVRRSGAQVSPREVTGLDYNANAHRMIWWTTGVEP
jgi:mycobactin lysine-N-oxygenase